MPPTITVIIPTYNSARWIEETLASVLSQTYPQDRIDLIVSDDVSPDDGVRVARAYLEGKSLRHQVVVREKNAGTAANRNAAWRAATGEWIQFLDQDDILLPHKLALQAEVAERADPSVAVIYSSFQELHLRDGSWQRTGPIVRPNIDHASPVAGIIRELGFGYVGPTLMRRSAVAAVGGFEERPNIGEDINLMLRLAMNGWKFVEAPSESGPAFLYRQTPGSLWKTYIKNKVAMRNLLLTLRMTQEFLRAHGQLSDEARRGLALRYARIAGVFAENDSESFRELAAWLHELNYDVPPGLGAGMRFASRALGYGNALRLRSRYRALRGLDRAV